MKKLESHRERSEDLPRRTEKNKADIGGNRNDSSASVPLNQDAKIVLKGDGVAPQIV